MQNKRNYYRILHIQPDAPAELVRMSYRTIMQRLKKHPDLGGDEWDAAVINEAYAVLSDEALRSAYDEQLLRQRTLADAATQSPAQRSPERQGQQFSRSHSKPNSKTSSATSRNCFFCSLSFDAAPTEQSDCAACCSPLLPWNAEVMDSNEQRRIQRHPNYCPLDIHTVWPGEVQAAVLADLSPNGLQIRCASALLPGQVLKLECGLFTAVAEVAHCKSADSEFLLGAKFLSVRFAAQQGTFISTSA